MLISFTRNWQNYLKSLATFHQWTKLCLRVNDVKMIAEKYQIQNVGSDILKNDGKPRAAIEALTGWETEPLDEDIVRTLNNLPPVTPTDSEDCISREFALEVISDYVNYPTEGDKTCAIKNAPSLTPTERTGEWIPVTKVYRTTEADFPETHIEWETATEPDDIDAVRCSECGEVFDFESARNWCTQCGARMNKDGDTE